MFNDYYFKILNKKYFSLVTPDDDIEIPKKELRTIFLTLASMAKEGLFELKLDDDDREMLSDLIQK